MRSAQNLCFVVNRFYALFRLNGSSKPSLTSKPLLTIALKILKTIEKPLVPMVGPQKKHSMVMVQLCQNHWKTIDSNGGLKKNINHSIALKNWPSLWSTPSLQQYIWQKCTLKRNHKSNLLPPLTNLNHLKNAMYTSKHVFNIHGQFWAFQPKFSSFIGGGQLKINFA